MDTKQFYANGKLLLSGEYFVLDGALALAVPLIKGQSLLVRQSFGMPHLLEWESLAIDNKTWFKAHFDLTNGKTLFSSDETVSQRILQLFDYISKSQPTFYQGLLESRISITTRLDFDRQFGFGTSSTLVTNLANWANVNPYSLLEHTFGGSGYDIACAQASGPIFFQRLSNNLPQWVHCPFDPPFKDQLYLVYLGKKQNSREGIRLYRQQTEVGQQQLNRFSQLAVDMVGANDLPSFNEMLKEHENLVSEHIGLSKAQDLYFGDYWGCIKSLGAWGGDFVLATSDRDIQTTKSYFETKGFTQIFEYNELILNN